MFSLQRCWTALLGLILWCSAPVAAQPEIASAARLAGRTAQHDAARRVISAARRSQALRIDGRLDEAAWQAAPAITDLVQRDPVEGAPVSERTTIYVLYDDEALYVGAMLHDSAPDSVTARLGRRDANLDADRFGIFIDPYHDRRSGYYFGVNAAGTLYDGVLLNDDWDDDSWDGVWEGKVARTESGWTAELRIPYSQLRFYQQDAYVWGVNFVREIARKNERAYLAYTPRNESGFVSRFYDLVGIEQITPPRQLEVLPYATLRAEYTEQAPGNPFNDGARYVPDVGADLKLGLTNNLTLNATFNPDFGQVEVDPAVVNLSDRETFFPEKRPFFIDGASVFNFGSGGANNNWGFNFGNPNLFYTRRVGRAPSGSLPGGDYDYVDRPGGSRILGAAKLTGRLGGKWNVGTVQALTARTLADLAHGAERFTAEVEPLTYYGVARGQRDWNEGRQALGFMATTTLRSFQESRLRREMNDQAYTLGLDGWTFLDPEKTWVVTGWGVLSHVRGTHERITRLQRSPLHYFQRPDARHVAVDSGATSMTGLGGRLVLNKQRGDFYLNAAVGVLTPSLDLNDVGFMWQTDVVNTHLVLGYRWSEPTRYYRNVQWYATLFRSQDFGGNPTWAGLWSMVNWQLPNYYRVWMNAAANPKTYNNRRTRGGPLTVNRPGFEYNLELSSDSRKAWVASLRAGTYQSSPSYNAYVAVGLEWRPAANLSLSLEPELNGGHEDVQWVGAFDDPTATATFGRRYVFAELDQATLAANIRLNWTFSPTLSLQLFAQPLLSAGQYDRFKQLDRPKAYEYTVFGEEGSTYDAATRTADPDGPAGPAAPLALGNPDFNFKSLRGTAVLRWEYRPGSTLYLVWTQARSHIDDQGRLHVGDNLGTLFGARPDNIFMVKFTYWLSR